MHALLYAHLKCNVGILMHSEYFWFIAEGQALHIVSVCLDFVSIRRVVDTWGKGESSELLQQVPSCFKS